ncbi:zinc finger protein [Plasmodium gonderi]|uniref:Zinc finger protein n=1 Tax=Plasmodium gonderi TaxID=77519 RepID=A0A1Y1JJJ1_PLAGO|nr:zinc finger protein [Plasmodium gonderi]GAW81377.1 zinc finger protein [Plasmodium gonderi]
MTRHSKNNTANPIFTYHERKKVTDAGTLKERIGKDSMRKFEQCWICLRNAEKPVSTPHGHIFCKICIVNNFLAQKKVYAKKKKEYDEYINDMKKKKNEETSYQMELEKRKFVEELEKIDNCEHVQKEEQKNLHDISNNFWLAHNKKVKKEIVKKKPNPPSKNLTCPISRKTLKMADLITINPEVSRNTDTSGEEERWICSYSKKNIDHHEAVLIKKTGKIILKSIFEKFIYGKKNSLEITVEDGDFIHLKPGGTAFCSHSSVEKTMYRESLL